MLTKADEGGGGVSEMLTIADGGVVQEALILADVMCETPLKGPKRLGASVTHRFANKI